MFQKQNSIIRLAFDASIAQCEETMGEAFPGEAVLNVIEVDSFGAVAAKSKGKVTIRVSRGTVSQITQLWQRAMNDDLFDKDIATIENLTHASLVWLMLHELHHDQMGHFEILDKAYLTEGTTLNTFGLVERADSSKVTMLAGIKPEDIPKVEPCLELQADHDALEMLIDAYSPVGWDEIRARTLAISGMMILIEREDAKHRHTHSSHPKAATRIFQLLGHVTTMPLILPTLARQHPELNLDPALPSDSERKAFSREISVPSFLDAVNLARIAEAETIRTDLGDYDDFFRDIQIAKQADPKSFNLLTTAGARQWAELVQVNSRLWAN